LLKPYFANAAIKSHSFSASSFEFKFSGSDAFLINVWWYDSTWAYLFASASAPFPYLTKAFLHAFTSFLSNPPIFIPININCSWKIIIPFVGIKISLIQAGISSSVHIWPVSSGFPHFLFANSVCIPIFNGPGLSNDETALNSSKLEGIISFITLCAKLLSNWKTPIWSWSATTFSYTSFSCKSKLDKSIFILCLFSTKDTVSLTICRLFKPRMSNL